MILLNLLYVVFDCSKTTRPFLILVIVLVLVLLALFSVHSSFSSNTHLCSSSSLLSVFLVSVRAREAEERADDGVQQVKMMPATKLLTNARLPFQLLAYHHLGVAVSELPAALDFYGKLGFKEVQDEQATEERRIMKNAGGLELQLFRADAKHENNANILMDFKDVKYPGHTHASFLVPSVKDARAYLEKQGLAITGERRPGGVLRAVFCRDPDRTTMEFEKNVGEDEALEEFKAEMVGNQRPIDHVGIRIRNPQANMMWYAEKLGFVQEVMTYSLDEDPLKNERPWITRLEHSHCDINFILNCNTDPSLANPLLEGGKVLPGIVYVGFKVDKAEEARKFLSESGVKVMSEEELGIEKARLFSMPRSFFFQDPDGNLLRLVE